MSFVKRDLEAADRFCKVQAYMDYLETFGISSPPAGRRSGRKGNWVPDYYDDLVSKRAQWQADMQRRVLDTAAALLAELGPRRFTVKEVARCAGYARTTLYKFFGLKAELLAACREHVARLNRHKLHGHFSGRHRTSPPRQAGLGPELTSVRHTLLALANSPYKQTDLWLLTTAEGLRSKRRPHLRPREVPLPIPVLLLNELQQPLERAQARGEIKSGTDPHELARWLGAIWWFEMCVRGPSSDGAQEDASAGDLGLALTWLLRGAAA